MLGRGVAGHYEAIVESLKDIRGMLGLCPLVANLESPVCKAQPVSKYGFRADPEECRPILKSFDALSVANNHALDCGVEGLRETVSTLRELGIGAVGYRSEGNPQEPVEYSIDGYAVSLIGLLDSRLLPRAVGTSIATCDDLDIVRCEILRAREKADYVICLLHAGDEMVSFPLEHEKVLPRVLLSYGVDVVVRSHAHTLQGYERTLNGLVFYGLGDFIFDGRTRRRQISGMVSVVPTETGIEFMPYIVHRDDDLRPRIATDWTSGYPQLVVQHQKLRRILDLIKYYLERTLDILAVHGLVGVGHIVSKILVRLRNRLRRLVNLD